jgi:hypothetical protein
LINCCQQPDDETLRAVAEFVNPSTAQPGVGDARMRSQKLHAR